MSRRLCQRCLLSQIRNMSTNSVPSAKAPEDAELRRRFKLLDRVLFPYDPHSPAILARRLAKEVLYHSPGDVVVVNKPYGVSCLGYKQPNGGVFKPSRYDQRADSRRAPNTAHDFDDYAGDVAAAGGVDENAVEHALARADAAAAVTLEKALPILADELDEPRLHFCVGLKRYVSGPVVLPCSEKAYSKIQKSFYHANSTRYKDQFVYRALAICMESPEKPSGKLSGYATFQKTRHAKEYVFVEGERATSRAVSGKFAVEGEMRYRVLDERFGCSLVDIHFTKFSRHLPRLMLAHLGAPILGDPIYDQRLIRVDGAPVVVEPKDRYRGVKHAYEPLELLRRLHVKNFADIRSHLPLLLTVYQSSYPLFGESEAERSSQLVVGAKPPDHFHAMAKLLKFDERLHGFLSEFELEEIEESEEPILVGKDVSF